VAVRGTILGRPFYLALSAAVFVALLSSGACATHRAPEGERRPVSHVVLFWLNDPSDRQGWSRMEEACLSFRSIPGVESVAVGRALPSDRPVVDSSFDLGVVITFRNPEALGRYLKNPIHQEALKTLVKPLVKRMQVYDIAATP
jgi:hypothetical protein